jgi:AcrR family transcriptional regulator
MSDDTRTRVLEAAGPIFAEKGYQDATVRDICQSAGVNLASVNYYFGDKETLYLETIKRARQSRASQVPMPVNSADVSAEERLRQFILTLLTRMLGQKETPWQSQLMLREILNPTRACRVIVEEHFRPEFQQLMGILLALLPPGTPDYRTRQVAFSVVGQCLFYRVAGTVVRALVPESEYGRHYTIEQLTEHIHRTTMASVEHGVAAAAPPCLGTG